MQFRRHAAFITVIVLLLFSVIPSDGWRYGQHWQFKCPNNPPADNSSALQNSHSGLSINGPEHTASAILLIKSEFSLLFFFFLFSIHSIHLLQTQQHKFVNWQCDLEYRGEDFTTAVTLGNPDVVVGSGTAFLF